MTEEQVRKIVNEEIMKLLVQLKNNGKVRVMDNYFMSASLYNAVDRTIIDRRAEVENAEDNG